MAASSRARATRGRDRSELPLGTRLVRRRRVATAAPVLQREADVWRKQPLVPSGGRFPLRPPVGADGHLQFAFMTDIQVPQPGAPTPNLPPSALTTCHRSVHRDPAPEPFAWLVGGPRGVARGERGEPRALRRRRDRPGQRQTLPDDGATQFRTVFDNEQSFGPSTSGACRALPQVPVRSPRATTTTSVSRARSPCGTAGSTPQRRHAALLQLRPGRRPLRDPQLRTPPATPATSASRTRGRRIAHGHRRRRHDHLQQLRAGGLADRRHRHGHAVDRRRHALPAVRLLQTPTTPTSNHTTLTTTNKYVLR